MFPRTRIQADTIHCKIWPNRCR